MSIRTQQQPALLRPILTGCTTLLLAAVLSLTSGCKKEAEQQMPPPVPVTVTQAVASDVPVYIEEIGHVVASESVIIRAQVSGQIIERAFVDGSDVKKGQLLFKIDPRPYQAALSQAKAAMVQAEASYTLAEQNFDNVKGLENTKAVSKEDFDTRKNAVATADAMRLAAKANVDAAQVKLDYCTITSPIDGRASERKVDVGNIVQDNGSLAMLSIQRPSPIYADFTIAEQNLGDVRKHMAQEQLKVLVWLPGESPETAHEGLLTFLDNAVSSDGTVKLRATLPNEDHHFWPGQFVRVRLILQVLHNAVLVPEKATKLSQQGSYVYVIDKDNLPQQRLVEVGQKQGTNVVITKNLEAGETVVVDGQLYITIHMPVLPTPMATPGQEGGATTSPSTQPATQPAPVEKPAAQADDAPSISSQRAGGLS